MATRKKESRNERFVRVVEKRVDKLINMIRLLGNCSNRVSYEYTPAQVDQVFGALQTSLDTAHERFRDGLKSKKRFSLSAKPEHEPCYRNVPHVVISLPDGSTLAAAVSNDQNHPSMLVYWTHTEGDETLDDLVCCAEYSGTNEVSAIAYKDTQEDPVYFESFHGIQREEV